MNAPRHCLAASFWAELLFKREKKRLRIIKDEQTSIMSMAAVQVQLPLPLLPQDWSGEKDFKSIGQLSSATQRNIEPVGPHFLAHARRVSQLPLIDPSIRCSKV